MRQITKASAEAIIFELYAVFKKSAMDCISMLDGEKRSKKILDDRDLYEALRGCLAAMSMDAVMIRQAGVDSWLGCFSLDVAEIHDRLQIAIEDKYEPCDSVSMFEVDLNRKFYCVSVIIENDAVILINPLRRLLQNNNIREEIGVVWFPVAATFREIFRQRAKTYGRLPVATLVEDWKKVEAGKAGGSGAEGRRLGGLLSEHPRETITLSLDLRKSTFAMEQAKSHREFADWMVSLVELLSGMARQSGAIFDKFTGDGVIVHFPVEPPWGKGLSKGKAIEGAVVCAAQMVVAVNRHLSRLRKNLFNDSGLFGAGVGIAVADAQWAVDREGNPLVVGRGVVGACRAADQACAGRILLVNSAYQDFLESKLVHHVRPVRDAFKTKEFDGDMDVSVWILDAVEVVASAAPVPDIAPLLTN